MVEEFKEKAKRLKPYILCDREENGYDDSDFYAVFWNEEEQRLSRWDYGTTRCCAPTSLPFCVDPDPEVVKKAQKWLKNWAKERLTNANEMNAEKESRTVRKGDFVKSLTTRGKNKNASGFVFWLGKNKYPPYNQVVGFENHSTGDSYFVPIDKVECKKELKYELTPERIEQLAQKCANSKQFHLPHSKFGCAGWIVI